MKIFYKKKEIDNTYVILSFLNLFMVAFLFIANLYGVSSLNFYPSLSNLSISEIAIILIIIILQMYARLVYVSPISDYIKDRKFIWRAILIIPIFLSLFTT